MCFLMFCVLYIQVILAKDNTSYVKLAARKSSFVVDKRRHVFYQRKEIQMRVKELLEHRCQFCPDRPPDRYFDRLRDHMKREHEKFFCDICVTHLQKFSCELKVYTRPDLARHRRIGDADDKSHKGHPLCEFCDQRYLDKDELHKHLRKDHFWCHFCERDGSQDYYPNYENLRVHFRDFHFLCEEDDCVHEQFTSVFRTKVDLQAHRAAKHSGNLTKAQARQARQLDVDITFAPRPRPHSNQGSVLTGRDFAEVRASDQQKGKREKGGNKKDVANRFVIENNVVCDNNCYENHNRAASTFGKLVKSLLGRSFPGFSFLFKLLIITLSHNWWYTGCFICMPTTCVSKKLWFPMVLSGE